MDDLIEAFTIFRSYFNKEWLIHCENNVLRVAGIEIEQVLDDDLKRLKELGFFVDGKFNCFVSHRFGSV